MLSLEPTFHREGRGRRFPGIKVPPLFFPNLGMVGSVMAAVGMVFLFYRNEIIGSLRSSGVSPWHPEQIELVWRAPLLLGVCDNWMASHWEHVVISIQVLAFASKRHS
jgi:hypothetical protein